MRVAIIGAGPSGVVALRALLSESAVTPKRVRVFERRVTAGGAWNYTPLAASDDAGVPPLQQREDPCITPMYKTLHTNIPAALMAYASAPFIPADDRLFPSREAVLEYLKEYAQDLVAHIQFNANVTRVFKTGAVWKVVWHDSSTPHEQAQEEFDHVVVASGHYENPKIPSLRGLEEYQTRFPGAIRHSKYYRTPEPYRGKKVLVVGSGPSGTDIARQISSTAHLPVLRSSRSYSPHASSNITTSIREVAEIEALNSDGSIVLRDGTVLENVDLILFCTGYLYAFPFLDLSPQPPITNDGEYLQNLYRQIFYIPDPSIAFLAMGMSIVPFPIAEAQSCYIARVWSGRLKLPDPRAMSLDEAENVKKKGAGRKRMLLGHPDDGHYVDHIRRLCLTADQETHQRGLLPVKWLHTERERLRREGPRLKLESLSHDGVAVEQ